MTVGDAASLADLKNHVPPEYDPTGVSAKIAASISSAVKAILIEQPYIDKDYRSTYYHFYAKKGQRYRADSVRLHFFDGTVSYEPAAMKLQCVPMVLIDSKTTTSVTWFFGRRELRRLGGASCPPMCEPVLLGTSSAAGIKFTCSVTDWKCLVSRQWTSTST